MMSEATSRAKLFIWWWRSIVLAALVVADAYLIVRYGIEGIIAAPIVSIAVVLALFRRYTALAVWVAFVFLAGLIIPAINAAAPAARKMYCTNNLREIAAAIAQYESAHGGLPCPFTTTLDGERLHSWRVMILPYLGHQALYDQIDLSKPWDDPANLKIGEQMPQIYRCPEAQHQTKWRTIGNRTTYVAIVGPETAWPCLRHTSDVTTSDARKLLVIELPTREQHWMAPDDPTLEQFLADLSSFPVDKLHTHYLHGNCACIDGTVITPGFDRLEANEWRKLWTTDASNSQ